ncbi:MAG TPA: superoxide dismutase [Caulobacteraceae bacterium]
MFVLPALPYPYDALEPTISDRTLRFHHDKHHKAYVDKLNTLLEKSGVAPPGSLERVIEMAAGRGTEGADLFNNAAQAWNHAFFWECMVPRKSSPTADLAEAIAASFGDVAKLGEVFVAKGGAHFGSGWVWLTADTAGQLRIETTHDAHDMVGKPDRTPLLVCDLWEHAYYLDYQNDRKRYLTAWFEAVANWAFAAAQLGAARGRGEAWRYPAARALAETA